MSAPPPILQVVDLTKTYRRGPEVVHALTGATLTVVSGELVALVGPSGSGKTTLLNLLCGWETPDSGTFVWKGERLSSPDQLVWGDIAIVPQALGLIEELTIRENVDLPRRFRAGREKSTEEERLLDDLGLTGLADRLPAEVSLGEQQRAAIARAATLSPALLLADEPTGHQDAKWADGVMRCLRAACAAGAGGVIATHNPEVLPFADRIVEMQDGRLRAMSVQTSGTRSDG